MSNESTSAGAGSAQDKFPVITELENEVRKKLELKLARLQKRALHDGPGILIS